MAQTLTIPNYAKQNIVEASSITADTAAGATTATLANIHNFAADTYMIFGQLGAEVSELRKITSVASNTVTVPALTFAHNRFDVVTALFGDKIKVYRASNTDGTPPADASFTLLDTVDIDVDQLATSYVDATGSSDYWYKFIYYNSTSVASSSLADSVAVRGGGYGNYCSIDQIRVEAGLQSNRNISDVQIDEHRQYAQQVINSYLSGVYPLPFADPVNALIQRITVLIASGSLLNKEYGSLTTHSTNNGDQKLKEGMDKLTQIKTGKIALIDAAGNSLLPSSASGVGGWPNDTTTDATAADSGGDRLFRISDVF